MSDFEKLKLVDETTESIISHLLGKETVDTLTVRAGVSAAVVEAAANARAEGAAAERERCEAELIERRYADAELAGTNSCIDDYRLALLFLKHRNIAKDLQRRWVERKAAAIRASAEEATE